MKSKKPLEKGLPTISTASQSRFPLFHPLKNVIKKGEGENRKVSIKTANGTVTVRGPRLTQTHKDILEYIFCTLKPINEIGESMFVTYDISLYKLQKALGLSTDNNSVFEKKFEDMCSTLLTLEPSESPESQTLRIKHKHITFGIVYLFEENFEYKGDKKVCVGFRLTFHPHFIKYISGDLRVDYPELVSEIFKLKNAESKALVRMFLTHDWYKTKLSNAMALIGISEEHGFSRSSITRSKKRIMSDAETLQSVFGINFSEDRDPLLCYEKHESVYFKNGREDSFLNFNKEGKSPDLIYELMKQERMKNEKIF